MDWQDRIVVDPKILVGKPVIKGTRIAVEFLMELLANGWTHEQILKDYPHLTEEDIKAALHYATALMTADYLGERATHGSKAKFRKAMSKVADVEPADEDKL